MGKNEQKPAIRFQGFTDAWEQRKLGELGTITTGSTPSTSIPDYYSDDGIVWVTPTDICENITFESARKLSNLGQQVGRVVPKNTILVTCIASIGKNTIVWWIIFYYMTLCPFVWSFIQKLLKLLSLETMRHRIYYY